MLNDALIFGHHQPRPEHERRHSVREGVQADLIVLWDHDPATAVRYPVIDIGDGGMRILSAVPLHRGMLGIAVKLLPSGKTVNRPCSVSWTRPPAHDGPFEIGLAFG